MSKPNLIYVFADQLRYQSVGYAGDKRAQTPNINALCDQSVNLCNAISGHPVCAPYRASLFTGKYTTSTGMVINEIRMNTNHHTFADVLNENGYETAYIGKWHLYANQLGHHYEAANSFIPPGRDRLGFDNYFAAYNFRHEYAIGTAYYHLDSPEKHFYDAYEPDAQIDMAVSQLKRLNNAEKPFALFLSLGTPHDPWVSENVPAEYLERFKDVRFELPENYLPQNDPHADNWARLSEQERSELTEWMRVYYAMTANLDYNIGRLMQSISDMGLDKNSIIVFTSDHGELFGAHGRRAKNIFYDEAVRVPFLIKYAAKLPATTQDLVFNTVDIMPSLLSLMELPIPAEVEGSDRSAVIRGEDDTEDGALMMGTGPTAVWGDGNEWRAYRTKQYTYAVFNSDNNVLLFDNYDNPLQTRNLASDPAYADIAADLRARMFAKMNQINDTFEHNTYYEKNWTENRCIIRTATLNQ